jgi:transposase-like protein
LPASSSPAPSSSSVPTPPVSQSTLKKRTFSAAYKLQIVEELKDAPPGRIAEVLRREGLYSSHLTNWRRALGMDGPSGLQPKKTGRPTKPEEARRIERLTRRNEQLERELALARSVIEIQKKVSELLSLTLPPSEMP